MLFHGSMDRNGSEIFILLLLGFFFCLLGLNEQFSEIQYEAVITSVSNTILENRLIDNENSEYSKSFSLYELDEDFSVVALCSKRVWFVQRFFSRLQKYQKKKKGHVDFKEESYWKNIHLWQWQRLRTFVRMFTWLKTM